MSETIYAFILAFPYGVVTCDLSYKGGQLCLEKHVGIYYFSRLVAYRLPMFNSRMNKLSLFHLYKESLGQFLLENLP